RGAAVQASRQTAERAWPHREPRGGLPPVATRPCSPRAPRQGSLIPLISSSTSSSTATLPEPDERAHAGFKEDRDIPERLRRGQVRSSSTQTISAPARTSPRPR